MNAHDTQVLIVAALGIALIVLLIVWLKLHAFLALTVGALFVGVGSGIPLGKVTASYETGVGGVLGYVGVLIALGAMLGKLLADSGGADKVVDTLLRGRPATLPWKMALVAAIIGIPMFFEIGLVLLMPVVMLAVHRSQGAGDAARASRRWPACRCCTASSRRTPARWPPSRSCTRTSA